MLVKTCDLLEKCDFLWRFLPTPPVHQLGLIRAYCAAGQWYKNPWASTVGSLPVWVGKQGVDIFRIFIVMKRTQKHQLWEENQEHCEVLLSTSLPILPIDSIVEYTKGSIFSREDA